MGGELCIKDEWYTPEWITAPLGRFDLDPCAPMGEHRRIAWLEYNREQDGLSMPWHGRVFCNPPFSQPLLKLFCERMALHGNGILLMMCLGFDASWFHDYILGAADALFIMKGRIRFVGMDGTMGGSPPKGCMLAAYGGENVSSLEGAGFRGKLVRLKA